MEKERRIYLVPIGKVNFEVIRFLEEELYNIYPYPIEIYKEIPIPKESFNKRRHQYLSNLFLDLLSRLDLPLALKILGITEVDLYIPFLNYIFGQAKMGGREAVISLARLNNVFYGLPEDIILLKERALKEAVHELGHTFGLEHCKNPKCVMYFSNSLKDTDYKEYKFCELCHSKISKNFR